MNDIGNKVRNKSQSKATFRTVISTAQLKSKEAVDMQNGIIFKENDFMQHFASYLNKTTQKCSHRWPPGPMI